VVDEAERVGGVAGTSQWIELAIDRQCAHLGMFAAQCRDAFTPFVISQMLQAIVTNQNPIATCERVVLC